MVCLELVADRDSKQPIEKAAIETALAAAYQEGVMIRISGNNIIISPALVITADHVATIVAALDVGLTAAAKA
jgi:adenosylmethionine-8-amino-7-oxononanoate aminotransferase